MKLLDIKYNKKFPFIHISLQSLYIMLFEFMVTGVLAWIMESYIEYAFQGYFCDRGFFCGPFIPMYGVFILIICVINIFPKFNIKNLLIVSVLAFFVITLFEEAVGVICEKAFGSILWTYGGIPFTSNSGYTNLFISLGWGIGGALYMLIAMPFIKKIALKLNKRMRITVSAWFLTLFLLDIVITAVRFNINGGYDELWVDHKRSLYYTLFLLGAIAYFILATWLFRFLSKKLIAVNEYLDIPCFLVSSILLFLPVFGAYEYIERTLNPVIQVFAALGFIDAAFLIYVLLGLIIIKLAEGIYRLVLKLIEKKKEIKNSKVYFYKNKFYKVICVGVEIIVSIFVCLIGFLCVKNPKTVNLTYGDGENTLNIVAVSDVHYMTTGCVISLDDLVEDINELNPDVVFMLGDIVDVNVSTISYIDFASYMSEINSTYGVYLITGNHEFESNVDGNNKVDKTKVDRWFTKVENECDTFHYLTDEEVVIGNAIRVIGRLDYLYGGSSNSRVSLETIEKGSNLTDEEKNLPLIVLDHQPQDYAQALEFGATLQLSGHTHDAQLFPGNWILDILYKVKWDCIVHGNYHCDNFDLYITRGYGAWGFPMRTTGRSEILDIDFKY